MQAVNSYQQSVVDEPILDLGPEFNQTARHNHSFDGGECPACASVKIAASGIQENSPCDICGSNEHYRVHAELQQTIVRNGEIKAEAERTEAKLKIANDTIIGLRESLTDLSKDYKDTLRKLEAAEKRIVGFEQMCKSFAEKIDAMNADLIFLTGKNYEQLIADVPSLPTNRAKQQADGFREVAL